METLSRVFCDLAGLFIHCLRPLFRSSSAARRAFAAGMEGLKEATDSMRVCKAASTLSS